MEIPIHLHVHIHIDNTGQVSVDAGSVDPRPTLILTQLAALAVKVTTMEQAATDAVKAVNDKIDTLTTTVSTTVTELQGLSAQLAAALEAAKAGGATPPDVLAAFAAVASRLDGLNSTLQAADVAAAPPV